MRQEQWKWLWAVININIDMNITLIDIGNIANDGTGDDLRTAFQKVNENFVELETSVDASTVAANIGGGVGIFKQKVENTLEFKSLETDDKLSVTTVGDKVVISTNFQNKNIAVGSLNATGSVSATSMTATMFNGSVNGNLMGRVYPLLLTILSALAVLLEFNLIQVTLIINQQESTEYLLET